MEMSLYEWIYQIVVEGIKYVILAHWFFGFEFCGKKRAGWLALYPLLIPVVEYLGNPYIIFFYYYSWGALILVSTFKGKLIEKIKAFFVMWFSIALVDSMIAILYIMITTLLITGKSVKMGMILGGLGVIFWMLLAWKCKRIQRYIRNFWDKLSNREYIVVLLLLVLLSFLVGGMQSNLDDATTISMQKATFIFGVFAVVIFVIILILLLYTKQSKKRLEEVNHLNLRYLALQKKYYEESLRQYEDMRRFRHDINNHIYVLSKLSEENKIAELKRYIGTMSENYENMRGVHSGNFIADCIISHTLSELQRREHFVFQLDGHFPEQFFLEDIDFCILLSNILDNAREALERVAGESLLQIEIKQFRQWLYLTVRNSAADEQINFCQTSKQDRRHHGYGVQNIIHVVEKYHGTVDWQVEAGMAEVKIRFDKEMLC